MPIELVNRGAKRAYIERKLGRSGNSLFDLIGRTEDSDTAAAFLMDRYISSPYAISYRNDNNQSVVRNFEPGSGQLITPPRASEKTPIDEQLRDQIAVGVEASASGIASIMRNIEQITGDHMEAHLMTKNKQAMDLLSTGIFNCKGYGGADLDLDIDYSRAAANSLTADFSAVTISEALKAAQTQLRAQGTPSAQQVAILGSNWAGEFAKDSDILALRQANNFNVITNANMIPQRLLDTEGLYIIDQFRSPDMIAPMWICVYEPGTQYLDEKGGTAADWLDSNEAVFFSLADTSYRIYRGVDAFNDSGMVERVVGEVVVDSFNENDPITTYIRSQTRHAIVYGNINHTVKSTGSNFN